MESDIMYTGGLNMFKKHVLYIMLITSATKFDNPLNRKTWHWQNCSHCTVNENFNVLTRDNTTTDGER